ncbi:hypothetical protein GCM10011495_21630 [Hymenobacter frigidus]|uniref:Uncharacterized protein n=1 Tax=Hymenobacter frigidus TaxID=1524095 RepID=A0ABQ2A7H2_9BACT|nr:hypothetical protein GCM10011495_21630 [Hymenobacter frigidus]
MGEWKNAATDAEVHTFITEGKQDLVSKYNEATRSVLIDDEIRKVPVLYVPDTNEIVVSAGGKSEKFTRVK